MTVTTFPNLNSTKACWKPSRIKVSLARPPFRLPPFRLRSMAVMYSVLRRQAPVKRRRICCQRCSTCSISRVRNPVRRVFDPHPNSRAGDAGGRSCPRTGETYASGYRHHHRRRSLYEPRGSVQRNQDIVVATTGRLLQYIKEENFDCRAVETLILDEADRMLDMGFAQDIEHIAGETRWRKQTLLFRQRWKAMRFRTLPSVCWKTRWKFLPIRPPVSAKNSSVVLPRR